MNLHTDCSLRIKMKTINCLNLCLLYIFHLYKGEKIKLLESFRTLTLEAELYFSCNSPLLVSVRLSKTKINAVSTYQSGNAQDGSLSTTKKLKS